ncbi:MAG: KEOPS complex subunit Cgi121 [Candidatus Asgardarchaeia archaeon]
MIIKWLTKSGLSNVFGVVGLSGCSNLTDVYDKLFSEINRIMKKHNVAIQLLDADKVADWDHLYFATFHSLYAFKNGYNISKNLNVEILLYSAATRQISEAISKLGLRKDTKKIAAVIVASDTENGISWIVNAKNDLIDLLGCIEEDYVLSLDLHKMEIIKKIFKITSAELKLAKTFFEDDFIALKNCVIERMSLLALEV